MSTLAGRLITKLTSYPTKPGWYTLLVQELAQDVHDLFRRGAAIHRGGFVTIGAVTESYFEVTTTPVEAKLNGKLKAQLSAIVDSDLFTYAGFVGKAVFSDGTDARDITLGSGQTARVALVVTDSNGVGGWTGEEGEMLYVAVVGGTVFDFDLVLSSLTDRDIDLALGDSKDVHDGATGWARLADIDWRYSGGSTVTPNRDT